MTIKQFANNSGGVSGTKQIIQAMTKAGSMVLMVLVVVATGCQQPDPSLKLKPLVDKNAEIWNSGNVKELDAILDPHFVRHVNLQPDVQSVTGLSETISGLRSAFPDLKIVVNDEIYGENKAVVRWTFTGTNTGSGNMPPTGKSVKIWGTDITRFANGKITEQWAAFDNQSIMEQLSFKKATRAAKKR